MPRPTKSHAHTVKASNTTVEVDDEKLDEMIEQATVDAYGESEQVSGFFTMIDDNLAIPFTTTVLGVEVVVEKIDITGDDEIVAVCARGSSRQRIGVLELPLPDPPPKGAEWIEAYRRWRRMGE
jgi:hypothetical protein